MRIITTVGLLLFYTVVSAQDTNLLVGRNFNNLGLHVKSLPALGAANKPAVYIAGDLTKPLLRKLDFWVTARRGADTLVIASDVFSNQTNWCSGPSSFDNSSGRLTSAQWRGLWSVSAKQADFHKGAYKQNGYIPAVDIAQWPGNLTAAGQNKYIAPYADVDGDLNYNPAKGDYPFLNGKMNVFCMGSDSVAKASFSQNPLNTDMSVMWFSPSDSDALNRNIIYFRLTLCNRDTQSALNQIRISAAADFQIGNSSDDYLATDVGNRAIIGYNADAVDQAFGANPPCVAIGFLNIKTESSIYIENSNDAVKGKPEEPRHFYNLAAGNWKTGTSLGYGGTGLDPTKVAKYVYPGISDPSNVNLWAEGAEGNAPGNRTGLLNTDTFGLVAKSGCKIIDGFICVAYAGNWNDSTRISAVLKEVHHRYNQADFTLSAKPAKIATQLHIYPNPVGVSSKIYTNIPDKVSYKIYTSMGKEVIQGLSQNGLIIAPEIPGLYFISCMNYNATIVVE